ncbi:COP9/signalosome complex subunit Csn1, partial [Sarracenia purpurea var. burkii]
LKAQRMAYDEVKRGENTQLFREIVQKIDGRLGPNYGPDPNWTEAVDRRAEQKKEKLENGLNAYRNSQENTQIPKFGKIHSFNEGN